MSLRLRMAIWSGGLIGLAMLSVGLIAYAVHGYSLYEETDRVLVDTAQHAADEWSAAMPAGRLAVASPNVVVVAYSIEGSRVANSLNAELLPLIDPVGLSRQPSTSAFGSPLRLASAKEPLSSQHDVLALTEDAQGTRWRLYLLRVDAPPAQYFLAATPLDNTDAFVQRFLQFILLLAGLGAVITGTAGWFVADRSLSPVATLTNTARSITRSRGFNRRVPVRNSRDELGELAATFNDMLTSLEKAYQAQQRFVADASHELRAPLTAIQANLDLLKQRTEMPVEEREEAVDEAGRESARLARLVTDLLALARADAGVPVKRQPVELDRIMLDSMNEARQWTRGQHIQVGSLETVSLFGDEDRLKQLFIILLDNALKYTPPDGQVTLTLRRDEDAAVILLQDTGVGIPAEDLPHVFDRFYRADPARGRDPGGTGLGLSIARWIVEQHGGEVTLESEVGRGTTARVRLPLSS